MLLHYQQVINFYMNMLMDRGTKDNNPPVHAFNTFFYPKLMSNGHAGVKRWTKRGNIDIFSKSYVLIPVHMGMHWCLAVSVGCFPWKVIWLKSKQLFRLLRAHFFTLVTCTIQFHSTLVTCIRCRWLTLRVTRFGTTIQWEDTTTRVWIASSKSGYKQLHYAAK